jgi:hypothetical protein
MVRLAALSLLAALVALPAFAQADHAQRAAEELALRKAQMKALCTPSTAGRKLPAYPPNWASHCPRISRSSPAPGQR